MKIGKGFDKEFRVEINRTGQGHHIIADSCIEAIKEASKEFTGVIMGIRESDIDDIHCQFWRNVPHIEQR